MALKKQEQLLLDSILQTANIVKKLVGNDLEKINENVAEMLAKFHDESKLKVILEISEDGVITAKIADYKSDFVRTRSTPDEAMLSLRAKINALPIEIKIFKDGVSFANKDVAEALTELSLIVSSMPVEMVTHGQDDWPREAGGVPNSLIGTEADVKLAKDESDDAGSEGSEGGGIASQDDSGDDALNQQQAQSDGTEGDTVEDQAQAADRPARRAPMSVMPDGDE